jgi:hypothetical protein
VKKNVVRALEEDGFEGIKSDWWENWWNCNDLCDYVVMKSVDFIVDFLNQVEYARIHTLAVLFIKRSRIVDQVLKKINYNDIDLIFLINYRPELAESHDKFFKVINKIRYLCSQEFAIERAVIDLFKANKHDSVIPLIDALEKRTFNGRRFKNVAVQCAFYEGACYGIKDIVREFHEHLAITSEEYAKGLIGSWEHGKSKTTFPFLLSQADQGDLEEVKKRAKYKQDPKFSKAIDDAFLKAEHAGARQNRPKRRAELVKEAFNETTGIQALAQGKGPGDIILGYLGRSERTESGKGQ